MRKSEVKTLLLVLTVLLVVSDGAGGARAARTLEEQATEMQEVSVNLTRLPEDPRRYNLVISDTEERVISGTFSIDQLQILRAVMIEAEKFSLGSEAVGTKDSITTRFTDKHENAFIVDVEKVGNQSNLFLTVRTETGILTMNSGRVIRNSRREEGFFFDLLSRLETTLPKLPGQSAK